MDIEYAVNKTISVELFISLLKRSRLAERRPVENLACIKGMIENANLIVSAWHNETLIGVARSLTDFHYACYLSDLAVDKDYQKLGVGKHLQRITQEQLGSECKIILLAAPDANDYYPHVGYSHHPRCWVLDRKQTIDVDK